MTAQKPGELPLVVGVVASAVLTVTLTRLDDELASFWPVVVVSILGARHVCVVKVRYYELIDVEKT